MAHAIDTQATIQALQKTRFAADQAEAITEAINQSSKTRIEHLATKADLYRALWIQGAGLAALIIAAKLS
ncbi:MAG: hypothetical protein OXC05_13900 [Halieaceae bacterium]|nr:hypothetical protein [Halieaceae bacterium]